MIIQQKVKTKKAGKKPAFESRAGDEARTRDLQLGRLSLYQLSYSRLKGPQN